MTQESLQFDKRSGKEMIREALERGEKLTKTDILSRFGELNGGGRLSELRHSGYPIHVDMIEVTKRNGKKAKIAQYSKAQQ